ncbi:MULTISPECIES: hypothetical protein [unclassified Pseudomonas]|nr:MULTISPECIES: hypothetical protein [unclassified Pseudomonas]
MAEVMLGGNVKAPRWANKPNVFCDLDRTKKIPKTFLFPGFFIGLQR